MRIFSAAAAIAAASVIAALPGIAAADAKAAIEDQATAFEQAFNAGDAEKVASFYAEDAAVFAPDAARIDGRQAIRDFWAGAINGGVRDLDLKVDEVHEAGDMAVDVGTLTMTAPAAEGGGRTDLAGKYIVVWQRGQDGTWRLYRDIWNMGQ